AHAHGALLPPSAWRDGEAVVRSAQWWQVTHSSGALRGLVSLPGATATEGLGSSATFCTAARPFSFTVRWPSTHQPMVSFVGWVGMPARFSRSLTMFCPVLAATCSIASMRPWHVWHCTPACTWGLWVNWAYSGILKTRTHGIGSWRSQ